MEENKTRLFNKALWLQFFLYREILNYYYIRAKKAVYVINRIFELIELSHKTI